jgi:hypothetical protein
VHINFINLRKIASHEYAFRLFSSNVITKLYVHYNHTMLHSVPWLGEMPAQQPHHWRVSAELERPAPPDQPHCRPWRRVVHPRSRCTFPYFIYARAFVAYCFLYMALWWWSWVCVWRRNVLLMANAFNVKIFLDGPPNFELFTKNHSKNLIFIWILCIGFPFLV